MTTTSQTVSVLIPTYHRPKLLRRAIDSVLKQAFQDFVIKISDNGSDDETKAYCERLSLFDPRVTYSRNKTNIGPAGNIHKLLSEVETGFYCILSDDDVLLPEFLSTCMRAFREHTDIALACTRIMLIFERQRIAVPLTADWTEGYYTPSRDVIAKMSVSHFTSTGIVFRKEIIDKLGGFHDLGDDRLFVIIASACCPIYVSEVYGAVFISRGNSYSGIGGVGRNTNAEQLCLSAGLNFSKVIKNVAPELQAEVNAVLLASYAYYLRQRLRQQKLFATPDCADSEQILSCVRPIAMDSVRDIATAIVYNLPRRLGAYVVRARRGWGSYLATSIAKYLTPKLDHCSIRYIQGDLAARDHFLQHVMTRMDISDR